MDTLGERIKKFRMALGLNQKDFAEACGKLDTREKASKWGQSRIGNYETGTRTPDLEDIRIISSVLNIEPSDLAFGSSNIIPATIGTTKVPLISYIQAGQWTGIDDFRESCGDYEYILTDLDVSENAFALEIKGDSMNPDFIEGDRVIIDPDVQPHAGEFVAAINGDYEATFKKYRPLEDLDAYGRQHFELIALNPDYHKLSTLKQEIRIIGTMVEHRIYRRKR
ncbi:LexA family repressor/S24 family protease [Mannheimia varigena USDA-ARS-USMARC-1296]|uniref:LexA family repressor/S24 family protease n=1 Tax=Mannheimia varigena USDA-ARS-USMARC-1296 TaxID=1433287 RepID=W0QA36_9PAST|nr:XRE family transcriptional regulator [Mannheimia varigena]AHG75406.1 LexA family repressor/S24 family protease [Mannheimia varigena USDA-ARS-USMARC-1296]